MEYSGFALVTKIHHRFIFLQGKSSWFWMILHLTPAHPIHNCTLDILVWSTAWKMFFLLYYKLFYSDPFCNVSEARNAVTFLKKSRKWKQKHGYILFMQLNPKWVIHRKNLSNVVLTIFQRVFYYLRKRAPYNQLIKN